MKMVFWYVKPCSLINIYQSFEGNCCLHLHNGKHAVWKKWNGFGGRTRSRAMIITSEVKRRVGIFGYLRGLRPE
jgi:hypothetical protein